MRRIMVSGVPSTKGRREHDPLGASACRGSPRRQRHSIFAAGTEVPSAKREEIKSASASVLKPADLRSGCLAHRHELRIRYDSHHQQQQKQYDYDEFDPFPTRVREPSNHCVDHRWIFVQIPPSTTGVLLFLSSLVSHRLASGPISAHLLVLGGPCADHS